MTNKIKKIGLGLLINVLMLVSALFNILEFIRQFFVSLVEIPDKVITGLTAALVVTIPAYLFIFADYQTGWRIALAICSLIIILLLGELAKTIANFCMLILIAVLSLFDFSDFIVSINLKLMKLLNIYLHLTPRNIGKVERTLVLLLPNFIYAAGKFLIKTVGVLRIATYPVLIGTTTILAAKTIFIDCAPPQIYSADFWLSVILVIIASIVGGYIAYALSQTLKFLIVECDYKMGDIVRNYRLFFTHWDGRFYDKDYATFNNHDSSQNLNEKNDSKSNNPYYEKLKGANTLAELKKKYYALAKQTHPDTNSSIDTEKAHRQMVMLNEAYDHYRRSFEK